jgi:hypothetical protein
MEDPSLRQSAQEYTIIRDRKHSGSKIAAELLRARDGLLLARGRPVALQVAPTLAFRAVTRYTVTRYRWRSLMAAAAERMKMMRQRRRARGLRELRLFVADARSRAVRRRVAKQVAGLDPDRERDALKWIEAVSEFDADATR